jgi:hypothetical protein
MGCSTLFSPPHDCIPLDKVKIMSTFARIEITRENLSKEARRCISDENADDWRIRRELRDFPSNKIKMVSHANSSKKFVFWKTTGICLEESTERFPIFAAEMFLKTVNPNGVPDEIADEWYRQIALLIATRGSAKIAYVFTSGNAYLANYWIDGSKPYELLYSKDFRKVGTWEMEKIDIRFTHPAMKGISENQINYESKKYMLGSIRGKAEESALDEGRAAADR